MIEALARSRGDRPGHAVRRPRRPQPPHHPPRRGGDVVHASTAARGVPARATNPRARLPAPPAWLFVPVQRACSRRSRRPGGSRSSIASSSRGWSTTSRARAAWERGCATTAAAVRFKGFTLDQISRWPLGQALAFFKGLTLDADERHIAGDLVREVRDRLTFLVDVGLDYLTLARGTPTLSGGESQRIRLASQIGSGLTGVLYVLDEPTIGLHPRDNGRLLGGPAAPPRPGQHAGPGRARPRGHRGGRPPRRLRARLGRGRRPDHRVGHAREGQGVGPIADRLLLERQGRDSRADQPPAGRRGCRRPGDRDQRGAAA